MLNIITKLILSNPFLGLFATKLQMQTSSVVEKIEVTYYPQLKLIYNRLWFESLDSRSAEGYLLHELLRMALQHPVRINSRDIQIWSIASDITVNQYVEEKYHSPTWVTIEKIALVLGIKIPYYQSVEFYYELLKENLGKLDLTSSKGEALLTLQSGEVLQVELLKDPGVSQSELSLLNTTLNWCMNEISEKNDLSTELLNELDAYRVDWRVVLKRFLSHRGRVERKRSYKRVSRRYEGSPGYLKSSGVHALVALDESGSMSDDIVDLYLDELKEINKITGVNIDVVKFDSNCSPPVPLSSFIKNSKRDRRGGTDFRPIFELADRRKTPLVIIFTDGDGEAPATVHQKVLWVLTDSGHKPADYGESVIFTQ